jgi:hypothetical protein
MKFKKRMERKVKKIENKGKRMNGIEGAGRMCQKNFVKF